MEKWLQFIHYTKINLNKIILPKSKLAHVYTTLDSIWIETQRK